MKQIKSLPTQIYLNECFDYNPMSGQLFWKERPPEHFNGKQGYRAFMATRANTLCGAMSRKGYLVVRLDQSKYYVHRIIWKLMTGVDPKEQIDHKNQIKHDNRFINLREATNAQNQQNRALDWRPNRHGYAGVWHLKRRGKFAAVLKVDRKLVWLGQYQTAYEAHLVYLAGLKIHHGEFAAQSEAT